MQSEKNYGKVYANVLEAFGMQLLRGDAEEEGEMGIIKYQTIEGKYHWKEYYSDWEVTLSGIIIIDGSKKWTAKVQGIEAYWHYSGYVNEKDELIIEKAFVDDSEGRHPDEESKPGSVFGTCDGKKVQAIELVFKKQ